MQKRHNDRKKYFDEQAITTRKYIIPYLQRFKRINKLRVLEIGCGEGGNLVPFLEMECEVVGIDLAQDKIENGNDYLQKYISKQQCELIYGDVFRYNTDHKFDVIFYRDVIEHIPAHVDLLNLTAQLLASDGIALIAFPPWQNPFGGHQQMLKSPILSKIPYIHLLPESIYRNTLRHAEEREVVITELLDLNKSKLSVETFKRKVAKSNLDLLDVRLYAINPNYEIKFKLKPVIQNSLIAKIPVLRNFLSTTCYAILKGKS